MLALNLPTFDEIDHKFQLFSIIDQFGISFPSATVRLVLRGNLSGNSGTASTLIYLQVRLKAGLEKRRI